MAPWILIGALVATPAVDGRAEAARLAAEAVEASPGVAALLAKVQSLERQADAARFRPDPVLMAEYRHPMSGVGIKLQQTFIYPGKNDRREAAARAAVAPANEAVLAIESCSGDRYGEPTGDSLWSGGSGL